MYKRERLECPKVGEWPLDDEIVALRVFGTDQIYELHPGAGAQTVGSSPTCDLVSTAASRITQVGGYIPSRSSVPRSRRSQVPR